MMYIDKIFLHKVLGDKSKKKIYTLYLLRK